MSLLYSLEISDVSYLMHENIVKRILLRSLFTNLFSDNIGREIAPQLGNKLMRNVKISVHKVGNHLKELGERLALRSSIGIYLCPKTSFSCLIDGNFNLFWKKGFVDKCLLLTDFFSHGVSITYRFLRLNNTAI